MFRMFETIEICLEIVQIIPNHFRMFPMFETF